MIFYHRFSENRHGISRKKNIVQEMLFLFETRFLNCCSPAFESLARAVLKKADLAIFSIVFIRL